MKTLLLLIGLSTFASASDNCYIFDRGTSDWYTCKEQALDNQRAQDRLDNQMRNLQNQAAEATNNAVATDQQNQDNLLMLKALLAAQQAQNQANESAGQ